MFRFCLLRLAAVMTLLAGASAGAAPADVSYRITPVVAGGRLLRLDVELQARETPGAVVTLTLPERLAGKDGLEISGADTLDRPADGHSLRLRMTAPTLRLGWALAADPAETLTAGGQDPVLNAAWFALRGEDLLIIPEGQGAAIVEIAPSPWTAAASLSGPTPLAKLADALFLGGRDYRVLSRTIDGAPVTVAYPTALAATADQVLERAGKVASAERRFWRSPPSPIFIGMVQLKDDGDFSGRGLTGGYLLDMGSAIAPDVWLRVIAHENLHSWISRSIGGFPEQDSNLEAWLNEGFTEAYTARILLESGQWTPEQFVADWNLSLARYGTSPVRTEPNSRILADRTRDFDVNKLPYDRGRLLAVLWDRRFRHATKGRAGLDEVLRAQMAQATQDERAGLHRSADQLFPVLARRVAHTDLAGDLARLVDRGEALELPPGAFGPCVRLARVTQPAFDRGFNFGDTLRAHGRLTGLEPGGPADRAGLREGDKLLIDEIPTHDSRVTLTYRVDEGGGKRMTVSYRPLGKASVTFQQLEFRPGGRARAACVRAMIRP